MEQSHSDFFERMVELGLIVGSHPSLQFRRSVEGTSMPSEMGKSDFGSAPVSVVAVIVSTVLSQEEGSEDFEIVHDFVADNLGNVVVFSSFEPKEIVLGMG